jgi:hypothetical protein
MATVAVPLLLACLAATPAGATSGSRSHSSYGTIPAWLPKGSVPVGRVVTASTAHPWLAVEGDSVRVMLRRGRGLVTAVGPAVPEEGAFPVPSTSPCTFTVTFAKVEGSVPLSADAFTITDEQGHTHRPTVAPQGGGNLAHEAPHGRVYTITLSGVLPTGNGTLHWTPLGGKPVVSWDFDVEID